jgi:HNH endonuclease
MSTFLPKDDLELHKTFGTILSIENFSNYINEITELIHTNELDRSQLDRILKEHHIKQIEVIKEELLDLLLAYINLILNDNVITENEAGNVKILKRVFKIKEGDFYNYRYDELEEVLNRQFERIYADNKIDTGEGLLKVGLQELFDLSYDQFLDMVNNEVKAALYRGGNLSDMDTLFKLTDMTKVKADIAGRIISQEVKDLVWNRDDGKCAQCDSNVRLEFDHIIPFSKGGSNTYRNIQLLCEECNRKKTNNIG